MSEQDEQPEIYIGEKPLGNYVKALKYRLNQIEKAEAVARGKHIRKAVDSVEIVKREEDVEVKDISIDTDEDENSDGENYMVSKVAISIEGEVDLETEEEKEEE